MRAAWWWIDRWRSSEEYRDFTPEQKGVYRDLIDELWLRDGLIPLDENKLARVAGASRATWKRVREVVLACFIKTPDGYRHETHDEVQEQASKRAERQKRYRERVAQRDDNVTHNVTHSLSPSPSPSPSPLKNTTVPSEQAGSASPPPAPKPRRRTAKEKPADPAPTKELIDFWQQAERLDGIEPHGNYARHAVVLRDAWNGCGRDLERTFRSVSAYFDNRDDFTIKRGHTIAHFQDSLPRWIREANGTSKAPTPKGATGQADAALAGFLMQARAAVQIEDQGELPQ